MAIWLKILCNMSNDSLQGCSNNNGKNNKNSEYRMGTLYNESSYCKFDRLIYKCYSYDLVTSKFFVALLKF